MTYTLNSKILVLMSGVIIAFFLFVHVASANTIVRSGETVSISEDQTVEGDLYVAAGTINISGVVDEDAVIMGGQITLNGSINKEAFLIGGGVDVHGHVGNDLRIISGEVTIAESIEGDLFVMGGSVTILSSASINGDVLLYSGDAVIEGLVSGDILGTVGNLRIDANVLGDVDVTVNQLVLGDRANIEGSVSYVSSLALERALNATIVGDVVRNDPVIPQNEAHQLSWLVPSLVLLFSVLVWYLMSRKSLNFVISRTLVKSPRPFLVGLTTLLFVPIACILLLVSMIGSFVGIVLLLGYLLFISLSFIGVLAVLGQLLMVAFNRLSTKVTLLTLIVGLVGFILLTMLSTIGQFLILICVVTTLGGIVDGLIRPKVE